MVSLRRRRLNPPFCAGCVCEYPSFPDAVVARVVPAIMSLLLLLTLCLIVFPL